MHVKPRDDAVLAEDVVAACGVGKSYCSVCGGGDGVIVFLAD